MNSKTQDLEALAEAIEKERGPLDLLALFQREDEHGLDLVFSAPWISDRISDAIGYVGTKAAAIFSKELAAQITRVTPVHEAAQMLADMFPGPGDYRCFKLYQVRVEHGTIVRLRPAVAVV